MKRSTPNPRRRLLVALAGTMLTVPGLPRAATRIVLDAARTNADATRGYIDLPGFAASRKNTGIAVHAIDDTSLLDAVKDAGFSFVRADLFWEAVDTPHGWDFSRYDTLVAELSERGLGALFILGGIHRVHSPNRPPTTPAQLAAFRRYVFNAAQRYKGKPVRFEVWNEQDHKTYWHGEPSPVAYRNVLKLAVQAVKAADPDAIVATGGVQQVNRTFIRAVGDIASPAQPAPDAVSVHPYRQTEPETVFADYAALRRDLSSYRRPPQIWATEWSYPSYGYNYVADIGDGHSSVARARARRTTRCGCCSRTGFRRSGSRRTTTFATTAATARTWSTTSDSSMRTTRRCPRTSRFAGCSRSPRMPCAPGIFWIRTRATWC
ncbi:cellulase family protein [Burkholderia pseudomallei]|nr:cellulase family protein [Burkholderia pseudomallei]